jgi:hypothetical protein
VRNEHIRQFLLKQDKQVKKNLSHTVLKVFHGLCGLDQCEIRSKETERTTCIHNNRYVPVTN